MHCDCIAYFVIFEVRNSMLDVRKFCMFRLMYRIGELWCVCLPSPVASVMFDVCLCVPFASLESFWCK